MSRSSVNKEEVKKFSNLAGSWWKKDGELRMLHQINPVRIKYVAEKFTSHFGSLRGLQILDVGCGGGIVTTELARLRLRMTGIDASSENIEAAIEYASKLSLNIEYICSTAENLEGTFDAVLCLEVLEHVNFPDELIKNIARLTRPGGLIILSTLNRNSKSYFLSIFMAENILKLIPKDTHNYEKYITPAELAAMGERAGLKLCELKGVTMNINVLDEDFKKWQLSDDIDVNYFATFIK